MQPDANPPITPGASPVFSPDFQAAQLRCDTAVPATTYAQAVILRSPSPSPELSTGGRCEAKAVEYLRRGFIPVPVTPNQKFPPCFAWSEEYGYNSAAGTLATPPPRKWSAPGVIATPTITSRS